MFKVLGGPGTDSFYFDIGCKFSLGRKEVQERRPGQPRYILEGTICRYTIEGHEVFAHLPLKIPKLPQEMPIGDALYREKTVKWLLSNGYVPQSIDDKAILLVEKSSNEQSLEVQELLRKFVSMSKIINKFLKYSDKDLHNAEIKGEEFQEWHQMYAGEKKDSFRDRVDLLVLLLEEGRQAIRQNNWECVKECLIACCSIAPQSFGLKELYGDFLACRGKKEASSKYMEVSWNKSGKDSVLYLERALRADPENQEAQEKLREVNCSQEWNLHLHTTAYLACADKTSDAASNYVRSAKRLNKGIRDQAVSLVVAQKDIDDLAARGRLESSQSSWKGIDSASQTAPSTPKSPRLGLGRSSQGTKSTVKEQKGSAQKKKFLSQKTDMHALEGLLWWYEGKEKWLKAEYVARYFLERIPEGQEKRFAVGSCLARVLQKLARGDEAARIYFELAKHEYACKRFHNAKEALELLSANLGAFTTQEKRVIYLLLLELKVGVTTPRLQKGVEHEEEIAKQKNRCEWAWFEIEHPDYVACAYTATSQFLFRKRTVEVISLEADKKQIFAIEIPPNTVPDELLLFAKKRITWLLAKGYIPEISSSSCKFSLPSTNSLLERLAHIQGEEVAQARRWLEEGSQVLAYYYMQLAFRKGPRTEELQALYGEMALLVKKPQLAYPLFNNLSPTPANLERALKAASLINEDAAQEVYKRILGTLSRLPGGDAIIPVTALHAYHYFQDKNPVFASRFFNKANGLLLRFVELACQKDPAQRKELYQALGEITCYDFYKTKRALVDPVFTPTTLDRQRHDMRAFVQSQGFQNEYQQIQRYLARNQDVNLTDFLEAIKFEEYERAEKAFLRAKERYTITSLQSHVSAFHRLWLEFTLTLTHTDNESIAPFFLAESNLSMLKKIKELAPESVHNLQRALDAKDYLTAKDCLMELHTDHEARDIQLVMKRLFIAYKKMPSPPGWRENFESLFTGSQISMEVPENEDVHYYLSQAQEAKGKLVKESGIVFNSICMELSSLGLYNLECALTLSQTEEVYLAIAKKLEERKQTATLFLLYIHAFFSLREQHQVALSNEFLSRAEQINPESLLFLAAQIEQLPFWAKSEKAALFSRVCAVLESQEELDRYLEKQKDFFVASSLEGMVKERCFAIFEEVDTREKRRSLLVAIDTLIDNGCLGPVPALLSDLKGSPKRAFMLASKENKPLGAVKALKELAVKYQGSMLKSAAALRLLEKRDTRRSSDHSTEALFALFESGRKGEASKRLQALKELDPTFIHQNPDDKLTLELLEKQLASLSL